MGMLIRLAAAYKKKSSMTPSMLIGSEFLSGTQEIKTRLDIAVSEFISGKQQQGVVDWKEAASLHTLMTFFKQVTLSTVVFTGLVDGVNPCAFAVIAFFVSFLSVYGYKKREILFVGSGYCLAVFLTYILIGVGLFEVMYRFSGFYLIKKVFYYTISGFCFTLFTLAVYDYWKFKKEGTTDDMILQLPKFLKKNIHLVISNNLRDKKDRTVWGLFLTSFVIGFCVAILEGACTGQLYLPAIALIAQNAGDRVKAFGYLLVYNVMFILPLVFIFTLSLWGMNSQVFNQFLKTHIGRIKVMMAVVFLLMAVVLLFLA
jgi:cytochrome c biogenesis protein CcdA